MSNKLKKLQEEKFDIPQLNEEIIRKSGVFSGKQDMFLELLF